MRDPVQAASYDKEFTFVTILWNILYNLGYMYNNINDVITFFYTDWAATPAPIRKWEDLGTDIGQFFVRFIYSRYKPRKYTKTI